jgi:HEAT repeat protein
MTHPKDASLGGANPYPVLRKELTGGIGRNRFGGRAFADPTMVRRLLYILAPALVVATLAAVPELRIRAGRGRAVEDAVSRLDSPNHEVRRRAQRRLASLGETARADLEAAAVSESAEARWRATAALRALADRQADPGERIRRQFPVLIRRALECPDELRPGTGTRQVLALFPGAAALAASQVAECVAHNPWLCLRAVTLVREIGHREGEVGLAGLLARGEVPPSLLHSAAEGLIAFGTGRSLPDLRVAIGRPDPHGRRQALRVLARIGRDRDAGLARQALDDPDPRVRAQACGTLGVLAGPEAVSDLARGLCDPDAHVRAAALLALAQAGGREAHPAVAGALTDESPGVRTAALEGLRLLGDPVYAEVVARGLEDREPNVRAAAVAALARLASPTSAVRAGGADPSPKVRRAALAAARRLPLPDRYGALSRVLTKGDSHLASVRDWLLETHREH